MKKFKLLLASAAILLSGFSALAQTITVKGVVSDETGAPVPGAGVVIDGTTKGTVANAEGEYTISVPANASLRFSTIGYKELVEPVQGRAVINVTLLLDATRLEDAVIVAYGTVSKESLTGSVTTLKSEEIASAPVTSVDKMLAGKLAGVTVTQGSGQPGSTSTIRVRGTSSISAGNEPLWVVDGIPVMAGDFREISAVGVGGGSSSTFLNPNDIESITILKDAAAASIYGSRAANGVILVTTKSGRSGRAKFTARAKYGVQQLANDNNLRPLTGKEALELKRVAVINAGGDPDDPTSSMYFPYTLLADGTTNWYEALTRLGNLQEYEINATGGNEKNSYYSSLAFHKNTGVYNFTDFQRFTARINADSQLTKTLKTGTRINLSYSDSNSPQMGTSYYINPQFAMWQPLPWHKAYNADGSLNYNISEMNQSNPLGVGNDDYNDKDYRLQGSAYLEWKILPYLTFKTTDGVEFVYVDSRQYWSPEGGSKRGATATMAYQYHSNDIRYTTSNTLTFDKSFGDHNVRAMAGQEAMIDTYKALGGYSPGVDPNIPYATTGTAASDEVEYGFVEETLESFFGYLEYSYGHKYSLQATLRTDGSSLFGADKKWGTFYSVGGSWNIANEKFLKNASGILSQAKVRASYGVNGNNNISAYRAYGTYATVQNNGAIGAVPSRSANPELSWEKNKTWNAGFDFGLFDDRLTGSVDLYDRITEDMLLSTQTPYTTGFGSNLKNVGSIQNKGVELLLDGTIFHKGDFTWTAGFNIAFNRSKVLDLADNEFLSMGDGRLSSTSNGTSIRIKEGYSLYTFYLRDWYGVNPSNGDGLWFAEDGTLTNDRNKARYIYVGSPEPKATGGFNTNLSWKGFTLGAYFQFVYGNQVLASNSYVDDGYDLTANTSTAALNYWKKPGDTGVSPKPVAQNPGVYHSAYSTRFLEDGSYLRIKDVTLSYDLPSQLLDKISVKGARVYISALNPYTFHNVTALDPEVGPLGHVEVGVHSAVKSLIGGVEISF
ncbi:MAG: TonB-dependent receptor [Bacteroidales bacterium]|nr:TonB-dependent receptor [Bacteroidales bacterium]